MRTAGSSLVAHLNTQALHSSMADLYTLTLSDYLGTDASRGMASGTHPVTGRTVTVCRWTAADTTLSVGGLTFYPNGPTLSRRGIRQAVGVEVTTLDMTLGGADWVFPNGTPLALAARNGVFDACRVKVQRVFMSTWGDTSLGAIHWFEGKGAKVDVQSTEVALTVKCGREDLNVPMPRRLYMPMCPYAVFSASCGLDPASFRKTCSAVSGSTSTSILLAKAQAQDTSEYYKLGSVRFTSGALIGVTRQVAHFYNAGAGANHEVIMELPFPSAPAPGDSFVLTPGCDHTMATCRDRYDHLVYYGGFPYVPKPESIR